MLWATIFRTVIGAIVGWIVGLVLARISFAIDNWRLNRRTKKMKLKLVA